MNNRSVVRNGLVKHGKRSRWLKAMFIITTIAAVIQQALSPLMSRNNVGYISTISPFPRPSFLFIFPSIPSFFLSFFPSFLLFCLSFLSFLPFLPSFFLSFFHSVLSFLAFKEISCELFVFRRLIVSITGEMLRTLRFSKLF